jgi:hypothetical protein
MSEISADMGEDQELIHGLKSAKEVGKVVGDSMDPAITQCWIVWEANDIGVFRREYKTSNLNTS